MGYHPRIETPDMANFVTTRSKNSELWLINNIPLERAILGYAAKFSERYNCKLHALAIEGSHIHGPILFPECNRAAFMRDFNSCVARAVKRHVFEYLGGKFWARRYSNEFLPLVEDIEESFFYTVLQPVQDCLVKKLSDYPGYNCFYDAVNGIKREYQVMDWTRYNRDRKRNPNVRKEDYLETVLLEYERLPGYEHLSQREYALLMHKKLEVRRIKLVKELIKQGRSFLGRERLLKIRPGTPAINPKTSTEIDYRPRVLCKSSEVKANVLNWYFGIFAEFKEASKRYLRGELNVRFPPGTYKPPIIKTLPAFPP